MSTTKQCKTCKMEKDVAEFYRNDKLRDGLFGSCKACTKAAATANRNSRIEQARAYDRARARLPHRRANANDVRRRWLAEDSRRMKCHNAVSRAVRAGRLAPAPCEQCGEAIAVAHHDDYDRPLDVRWLCHACHSQHHATERRTP